LQHFNNFIPNQKVRQSFAKSLANLKTDYLDSLVLHGPLRFAKNLKQYFFPIGFFLLGQKDIINFLFFSNFSNANIHMQNDGREHGSLASI
jgi:predicted oxidoreductase